MFCVWCVATPRGVSWRWNDIFSWCSVCILQPSSVYNIDFTLVRTLKSHAVVSNIFKLQAVHPCSFMFTANVMRCKEMLLKAQFCSVTVQLGWDVDPPSYMQYVKAGVLRIKLLELCNFQAIFCKKPVLFWVKWLTPLHAHSSRRNVSTSTCLTASKFTTTWARPSVTTAAACSGDWSNKDSNVKVWRQREGSWDLFLLFQCGLFLSAPH